MARQKKPATRRDAFRIGISGWTYARWRGVFYPPGLAHRSELSYASRKVNSIEINGSFYSLQRPTSYQRWHDETPDDFIFSVKGSRFITHMKKLRDIRIPLANFFASGLLCLREKLGPILWQFPPNLRWDAERFGSFFDLLPRDTAAAAELAREHDAKLEGRAWTKADAARPIRHAVEIRHPTFLTPEFFALLRKQNIAFVIADTAGKWPYIEEITADFVYCRLHGAEELYASGYTETALDWWARRLRQWQRGLQPDDARLLTHTRLRKAAQDIFLYFDNDAKVHAPSDAINLAKLLRE